MRVQQRRPARRVGLVDEQFDGRSCRRLDVEAGPADNLVLELESERSSAFAIQLDPPLAGSSLDRGPVPVRH